LAAITVGALLSLLPTGAPAQAASGSYACPKGYFCGWSGENATGTMMKTKTDMPTMGSWDNRIRSSANRTSVVVSLYSEPAYSLTGYAEDDGPMNPGEINARSVR
jgi:hypothetical protein